MDHLELRRGGRLDLDIKRNYDKKVILVSNHGIFHGHSGVKQSAKILRKLLPTLDYKFESLLIHRCGVAFEEWSGRADKVEVNDGIDAFIIRNGKIVVQTIYYTAQPRKDLGGSNVISYQDS